jgi:hypothetical protein
MEKDKGGRPTKLTENLINAIETVLQEKDIVVMTDSDLVMFTNELLEPSEQISDISFAKWKGGEMPEIKAESEIIDKFLYVIKKALYKERDSLLKELKKDSQWQRYAWILERKFKEWNLKQISEQDINLKTDIVWNEVKNYGTDNKTD